MYTYYLLKLLETGELMMKLIIAIVQDHDVGRLTKALSEGGFRSTKLASTGGFLKSGNTTFMIGCDEDNVDEALEIIKTQCSERMRKPTTSYPMRANKDLYNMSNIEIGGATVFVLPIESFFRF